MTVESNSWLDSMGANGGVLGGIITGPAGVPPPVMEEFASLVLWKPAGGLGDGASVPREQQLPMSLTRGVIHTS